MKRPFLIFLTLGLCMLAGACSSEEDEPIDGDRFHTYMLTLNFENESGENTVTGIPTWSGSDFVSHFNYSIDVIGTELGYTPKENQLRLYGEEGKELLLWSIKPRERVDDITLKFKCYHIFGDAKEHTLVTHWINQEGRALECDRLTFDGVEQTLFTPDPANTFIKGVKITLSSGK